MAMVSLLVSSYTLYKDGFGFLRAILEVCWLSRQVGSAERSTTSVGAEGLRAFLSLMTWSWIWTWRMLLADKAREICSNQGQGRPRAILAKRKRLSLFASRPHYGR